MLCSCVPAAVWPWVSQMDSSLVLSQRWSLVALSSSFQLHVSVLAETWWTLEAGNTWVTLTLYPSSTCIQKSQQSSPSATLVIKDVPGSLMRSLWSGAQWTMKKIRMLGFFFSLSGQKSENNLVNYKMFHFLCSLSAFFILPPVITKLGEPSVPLWR